MYNGAVNGKRKVRVKFDMVIHVPKTESNPNCIVALDISGKVWMYEFAAGGGWKVIEAPTIEINNFNPDESFGNEDRGPRR